MASFLVSVVLSTTLEVTVFLSDPGLRINLFSPENSGYMSAEHLIRFRQNYSTALICIMSLSAFGRPVFQRILENRQDVDYFKKLSNRPCRAGEFIDSLLVYRPAPDGKQVFSVENSTITGEFSTNGM